MVDSIWGLCFSHCCIYLCATLICLHYCCAVLIHQVVRILQLHCLEVVVWY